MSEPLMSDADNQKWKKIRHDLVLSPERIILNGYDAERKRMADICQRCPHLLPEFKSSQKFVSFILKLLKVPFKTDLTKCQFYKLDHIIRHFRDGICKQCAIAMAVPFVDILKRFHKQKMFVFAANEVVSCICTALLQYPFIAKYYFGNAEVVRNIVGSFGYVFLESLHPRLEHQDLIPDDVNDAYRNTSLFGSQILRNSIFLFKSIGNTTHCKVLMACVRQEVSAQTDIIDVPYRSVALGTVCLLLSLYFLHHKRNKSEWDSFDDGIELTLWRVELCSDMMSVDNAIRRMLCCDLLADSTDAITERDMELKEAVHKIGKLKRRDMECQYFKCSKKAKNMRKGHLFVCKGCSVARYCSKQCQKKDWNIGGHNKLCALFN